MGVSQLPSIVQVLLGAGMAAQTPAAVICSAHTASQRQLVCTLGTLHDSMVREGLASPAIVVIGDVVQAAPLWRQTLGSAWPDALQHRGLA